MLLMILQLCTVFIKVDDNSLSKKVTETVKIQNAKIVFHRLLWYGFMVFNVTFNNISVIS
jgi:hypothetical protein